MIEEPVSREGEEADIHVPPVPSISVERVLKIKNEIRRSPELLDLLDRPLDERARMTTYDTICKLAKVRDPEPFWHMVLDYSGRTMTPEILEELAWRVAGNYQRVREGKQTGHRGAGLLEDEWMAFQIVDAVYLLPTEEYGPRVQLRCRVLIGSYSPRVVERFWTYRYARFVAGKTLGFASRPGRRFPYVDCRQLFGLRFWGWCVAAMSREKLYFDPVACSNSMRAYNQDMMKLRARIGFDCPKKFSRATPCHSCPIGLDQCPAAVHVETYIFAPCSCCNRPEAPYKNINSRVCVECEPRVQRKRNRGSKDQKTNPRSAPR